MITPSNSGQPRIADKAKINTVGGLALASASTARARILSALGIPSALAPSNAPEPAFKGPPDFRNFKRHIASLARAKTLAAAASHPDSFIIGADTAIWTGNRALGKPASARSAERILCALSGRTHIIATAICVLTPRGPRGRRREFAGIASARVSIRRMSAAGIRAYVKAVRPVNCAGAYALQGGGTAIIEKISGDPSTVVGLPVNLLMRLLARAGFRA